MQMCSCNSCGNQRRAWERDQLTMQEKRAMDDFKDQIIDLDQN